MSLYHVLAPFKALVGYMVPLGRRPDMFFSVVLRGVFIQGCSTSL